MADVTKDLVDELIKHSVDLERYSESVRSDVIKLLNEAQDEIISKISVGEITEWKKARLTALNKEIDNIVGTKYGAIKGVSDNALKDIASYEADHTIKMFKDVFAGSELFNVVLTQDNLEAIATKTMLQGHIIGEWWDAQSEATKRRMQGVFNDVTKQLQLGVISGEAIGEMVKRIRGEVLTPGVMTFTKREATALVRTSTLTIANETRRQLYDANKDIFAGYEWISTLDNRTTPQCQALDKSQWDINFNPIKGTKMKFPGWPPVHWQCRSTLVPITKAYSQLKRDVSKKRISKEKINAINTLTPSVRGSMGGPVPATMNYNDWLLTQPEPIQRDVLGDVRWQLWSSKKIKVADLVTQEGRPLTIKELRIKYGVAESAEKTLKQMAKTLETKIAKQATIEGSLNEVQKEVVAAKDALKEQNTLFMLKQEITGFKVGSRPAELYERMKLGKTLDECLHDKELLAKYGGNERYIENDFKKITTILKNVEATQGAQVEEVVAKVVEKVAPIEPIVGSEKVLEEVVEVTMGKSWSAGWVDSEVREEVLEQMRKLKLGHVSWNVPRGETMQSMWNQLGRQMAYARNKCAFEIPNVSETTLRGMGKNIGGRYSPTSKEIEINIAGIANRKTLLQDFAHPPHIGEWTVRSDVAGAMCHEYGHHIYFQVFPTSVRMEWPQIFMSRSKGEWTKLVSKYGSANSEELFAECFSAWTHPKYRAGMLPKEVEEFFKKTFKNANLRRGEAAISNFDITRKLSIELQKVVEVKTENIMLAEKLPMFKAGSRPAELYIRMKEGKSLDDCLLDKELLAKYGGNERYIENDFKKITKMIAETEKEVAAEALGVAVRKEAKVTLLDISEKSNIEMTKIMHEAEKIITGQMEGGVNTIMMAESRIGDKVFKCVWKSVKGERRDYFVESIDNIPFSLAQREALAYDIANEIGFGNRVVPTIYTEINGEKGMLQVFIRSRSKVVRKAEMLDISMYDYVIGNIDRHYGNVMRRALDDELVWIDHGYSFPKKSLEEGRLAFSNRFLRDNIHDMDFKLTLEEQGTWINKLEELKKTLPGMTKKYSINVDEFTQLTKRIDDLLLGVEKNQLEDLFYSAVDRKIPLWKEMKIQLPEAQRITLKAQSLERIAAARAEAEKTRLFKAEEKAKQAEALAAKALAKEVEVPKIQKVWTNLEEQNVIIKKIEDELSVGYVRTDVGDIPIQMWNDVGRELSNIQNKLEFAAPKTNGLFFSDAIDKNIGVMGKYESADGIISISTRGRLVTNALNDFEIAPKLGGYNVRAETITGSFAHEYGHVVYTKSLRYDMQDEWVRLYASQKKFYWKANVSQYGSTNASELFAESFSAYMHPKYAQGMLPKEIEEFFAKTIGNREMPLGIPVKKVDKLLQFLSPGQIAAIEEKTDNVMLQMLMEPPKVLGFRAGGRPAELYLRMREGKGLEECLRDVALLEKYGNNVAYIVNDFKKITKMIQEVEAKIVTKEVHTVAATSSIPKEIKAAYGTSSLEKAKVALANAPFEEKKLLSIERTDIKTVWPINKRKEEALIALHNMGIKDIAFSGGDVVLMARDIRMFRNDIGAQFAFIKANLSDDLINNLDGINIKLVTRKSEMKIDVFEKTINIYVDKSLFASMMRGDLDDLMPAGRDLFRGNRGTTSMFSNQIGELIYSKLHPQTQWKEWIEIANNAEIKENLPQVLRGMESDRLFTETFSIMMHPLYKAGSLPIEIEKYMTKNIMTGKVAIKENIVKLINMEKINRLDTVTLMHEAEKKVEGSLGGGVNDSRIVASRISSDTFKCVWKPESGEVIGAIRRTIKNDSFTLAQREALAYEVAENIGFADNIPPTIYTKIDDTKGMLQLFENGDRTTVKLDEVLNMSMFDYIIGNTDRHMGNIIRRTSDQKLMWIDHGYCFPDSLREWRQMPLDGRINQMDLTLTNDIQETWIKKLNTLQDGLPELLGKYSMNDIESKQLFNRILYLKEAVKQNKLKDLFTYAINGNDPTFINIERLEAERLAKLEVERLAKLEVERLAKLEVERLAKLEVERLAKLEVERLAKIEVERLAKIEVERLAKIEEERLAKIEEERLAKLEIEKVEVKQISHAEVWTDLKEKRDIVAKFRKDLFVKDPYVVDAIMTPQMWNDTGRELAYIQTKMAQKVQSLEQIVFKKAVNAKRERLLGEYDYAKRRITLSMERLTKDRINDFDIKPQIGMYITRSRSVTATIAHEYGHHVFAQTISDYYKTEWIKIYVARTKTYWKVNVSIYSASSPGELFAESFATYMHPLYKQGMLPREIEQYFERTIMHEGPMFAKPKKQYGKMLQSLTSEQIIAIEDHTDNVMLQMLEEPAGFGFRPGGRPAELYVRIREDKTLEECLQDVALLETYDNNIGYIKNDFKKITKMMQDVEAKVIAKEVQEIAAAPSIPKKVKAIYASSPIEKAKTALEKLPYKEETIDELQRPNIDLLWSKPKNIDESIKTLKELGITNISTKQKAIELTTSQVREFYNALGKQTEFIELNLSDDLIDVFKDVKIKFVNDRELMYSYNAELNEIYIYPKALYSKKLMNISDLKQSIVRGESMTRTGTMLAQYTKGAGIRLFDKLPTELQKKWIKLFNDVDVNSSMPFPMTDYGDCTPRNGFAEAFSLMMHPQYQLGSLPSKVEKYFIKDIMKEKVLAKKAILKNINVEAINATDMTILMHEAMGESQELLGGGINMSFIADARIEDKVFKCAWKPESGENFLGVRSSITNTNFTLAQREVLAYDIANKIDLGNKIPPTIYGDIGGEKGMLQVFIKAAFETDVAKEEVLDMAMFDYIIGNTDRHFGNMLRSKKNKELLWIDHGYCFPDSTKELIQDPVQEMFRSINWTLTSEQQEIWIRRFDQLDEDLPGMISQYDISKDEKNQLLNRIKELKSAVQNNKLEKHFRKIKHTNM